MNCKRGFVKNITLVTRDDDAGRRLDRILRKALPDMPLSALHKLLRKNKVLVDGLPARGEARVPSGSRVELPLERGGADETGTAPRGSGKTPRENTDAAKLDILLEEAGILILNKPAGLAVHGGGADPATLENLARAYLQEKLPPSLSFKPGPLHRLDKPTSGIIVFGLSLEGARQFSALLKEGMIRKRYLAIVEGTIPQNEVWEDTLCRDTRLRKTLAADKRLWKTCAENVGAESHKDAERGKNARCRVTPLAWTERNGVPPARNAARGSKTFTLVRVELETGRTHQIRAQAAVHGHPLAGDRKYGGAPLPDGVVPDGGFFLHARELELPEGPFHGIPRLTRAALPERFALAIQRLFNDTCTKGDI